MMAREENGAEQRKTAKRRADPNDQAGGGKRTTTSPPKEASQLEGAASPEPRRFAGSETAIQVTVVKAPKGKSVIAGPSDPDHVRLLYESQQEKIGNMECRDQTKETLVRWARSTLFKYIKFTDNGDSKNPLSDIAKAVTQRFVTFVPGEKPADRATREENYWLHWGRDVVRAVRRKRAEVMSTIKSNLTSKCLWLAVCFLTSELCGIAV